MTLTPIAAADAYGPHAKATLLGIGEHADAMIRQFVGSFYKSLLQAGETQAVLNRLTAEEFAHLHNQQAAHLRHLIAPDLDADSHRARATRVGRVHSLVGVDMLWLIEAYGLYQQAIHQILLKAVPSIEHQREILRVLDRRLLLDLEAQSAGYRLLDLELSRTMAKIHDAVQQSNNSADLFQEVLRCLSSIEGIVASFVGRVGKQGLFECEAWEGTKAQAYLSAMDEGLIPPIQLSIGPDEQIAGPAAQAWRSGQIRAVDAYELDHSLDAWRFVGGKLGFRSSVCVPLVDDTGQTFALLSIYSAWPGFFNAMGRSAFFEHVQQAVSSASTKHAHGQLIPYQQRLLFSRALRADRVQMLYQPIIDLKTGRLLKVEALARLVSEDGRLISPAEFLPALGNQDLLQLFEIGLRQVCADLKTWQARGFVTAVALNLPPEGVGDARYHDALFVTLERCGTNPALIELEILESQDTTDVRLRDQFFSTLKSLGVRIVQDDLGAGHSSLLRMDSMPFDAVKIDQGLVLRASQKNPQRALEFIYHLTHLARALFVPVTVEGLEHEGLIEAAAVLGADRGQGFGIARPMPASAIPDWGATFAYSVDVQHPRTALGALAGYLLWDRQLSALNNWPDLIESFVQAPCAVQKFINRCDPPPPGLQNLLTNNHAFAIQGSNGNLYKRTRRELADLLSRLARSQFA
ncbi:MAG: EAL domain-containing protein [Proteobacteria bacterium]|nr:EAL domain-containing protein [Pseudomonadota bacterium]